jgi:predicted ATPase/transcriptional regulator with XRE-family HTH domain
MDGNASFGHWIKLRRQALHLTQEELARKVFCSIVTIRKIEADARRPSPSVAERLALHLALPLDQRAIFLKVARAELSVDRLAPPTQIDDHPSVRSLSGSSRTLPAPSTPLIGREQEVAAVQDRLLRSDVRLLTLLGPPGIGKTRLCLAAAAELQTAFADGVAFVSLEPIRAPAHVATTIAQTLGVQETGDQPLVDRLKEFAREKQLLLVLDNFEQVLDAAPLITELLAACPGLKALVTSREILHLRGEKAFPVPPLALPDLTCLPSLEQLTQYAAVALFIERALDVNPAFAISNTNASAVTEICHRLDGLPLAIELAAARIRLFTPQALLARLGNRLALLTGGARDLPPHQRTLRSTIDWSHDLLQASEQILFRRLAVFVGGCTLVAAEAVCTAGEVLPQDVLDSLASLSDKSLLRPMQGGAGEPRLTMLETIREYALERLEGGGEAEALRQRHAAYFLDLAERAAPQFHRAEQQTWLARLEAEHDNLRAALTWALDEKAIGQPDGTLYEDIVTLSPSHFGAMSRVELGLRLAGALAEFWSRRGYLSEGCGWLEASLARAQAPTAARARALNALGDLTFSVDLAAAPALYEESLKIGQVLGDKQIVADAYYGLGGMADTISSDWVRGAALFEQALALYRELGDTVGSARLLNNLGGLAADRRDYTRAMALCEESLALYRELGDTHGVIWALLRCGMVARWIDVGHAAALVAEGLTLCRELGNKADTAWTLIISGDVAQIQGNYRDATMFLEEALALCREIGNNLYTAWALDNLGDIALYHGDAVQAAALFEQSLSLFQAVGYKEGIAQCLVGFGGVACAAGRIARAARLCGAAEALRDAIGWPMSPDDKLHYDRTVAATRAQLEEETFVAAWAEGKAMTLEQAIANALEGTEVDSVASTATAAPQ